MGMGRARKSKGGSGEGVGVFVEPSRLQEPSLCSTAVEQAVLERRLREVSAGIVFYYPPPICMCVCV